MHYSRLFTKAVLPLAMAAAFAGQAQADTLVEDFEAPFPTWESGWFGANSTARNYYCQGALGCTDRGNNPDGLWITNLGGGSGVPVTVSFNSGFGASLSSLTIDVAAYSTTTLTAWDSTGQQIFSSDVTLTGGAYSDPGVYATYTITSAHGIGGFAFSGAAAGNTSIDNLVAVTSVPEPQTLAMMMAGLALVGAAARRQRG